jgi:AraC-like DNA-binding protein
MAELQYNEWAPNGAAADLVRCIWSLGGEATGRPADPIVSDGCVELVFNLADPFEQATERGPRLQPLAMIVGPTQLPTLVRATGRIDIVGVRLQPWAGARVLATSMSSLRDQCIALDDVTRGPLTELSEQLAASRGDGQRFALASSVLVAATRAAPEPVARVAVEQIPDASEAPGVRELARRMGRSVRTMQRVFAEEVGLSPKALLRIARVQRALALARIEPPLRWITIAARAGYHDQSHFVREFKALVGCLPSAFRPDPDSLTAPFLR